ncbi:glycosyltransferase [Uliginosibacterium sp. sgz301328]|uniref:glycosyltransferase n=1 Tax=Uliginosibacterium sp. sgz301328 TaxID=3243764 RepID=UPI00359EBED9
MHVLMISDVFFPRINGVSTSIETFRAELHAQGVRTSLLAPAYPAEDDHDDVIRIESRYLPMDPEDRMMKRGAIRQWLAAHRKGTERFDLVHIQTPFVAHYAGLEIARTLGVPAVATYHTYFEEYLHHYVPFLPEGWMRGAARRFSRSQCNALDAVIVPSRAMADTLAAYGVERPVHILPTGLPNDRFGGGDGDDFRTRYRIEPNRPLLLFVGRVAHEKNIAFLIEVMGKLRASHPEALLLVTGEGPALGALREQVTSAGLTAQVRFLGYLDRRHELADCYRAADVFVFASRTETQGLVLLEAMAQGKPVVALSVMGTRDILEGAPGAMVAPDDVRGFAECVRGLLESPVLRQEMGEQARQYAHRWRADEMARRMAQLYESMVTPLARSDATSSDEHAHVLRAG